MDASSTTEAATTKPAIAPDGATTLGGQYAIHPKSVVAALSTPTATAVEASDRRQGSDGLAALICNPDMLPRVDAMSSLKGLSKQSLLPLRDFGPVDWSDGKQRLAAIYTAPRGGRFTLAAPMTPWQIIEALLKPGLEALKEIHSRGVVHRTIRPDNLFLREAGATVLALGPCVATPPGYTQPAIYEPLETASADPAGRGDGSPRHDMFALGMTALALLLGREPGSEFGHDELMIRRLEWGSFGAVVDPSTVPPDIVDALTGLLTDTASERWTVKDLELWLRGGRPDPPRIVRIALAQQPYMIGGQAVRTARSFAYMVGRHWAEGAQHLRSEALQTWLFDQAGDRAAASLVDQVLRERAGGDESGVDSNMLVTARAVMAIDTQGPIRFGGVAVDPYGLGPFLFDALSTPQKRDLAVAILDQQLPQKIMDLRPPDRRRATRQAINFERLRRWALSPHPWEGIERCIYDLNPFAPCLSPLTSHVWVGNARTLAITLDKTAQSGDVKVDRSMAAFLAARADADGDTLAALMTPAHAASEALRDAIRLFADLQRTLDSVPLHGLTRWLGGFARQIGEAIHHRPTRSALLQKIEEVIPEGRISALITIVDIEGLTENDARGFAAARSTWEKLERHIWALEREAEMKKLQAWQRGRDNVPLASGAGAIIAFLGTLFLDSAK